MRIELGVIFIILGSISLPTESILLHALGLIGQGIHLGVGIIGAKINHIKYKFGHGKCGLSVQTHAVAAYCKQMRAILANIEQLDSRRQAIAVKVKKAYDQQRKLADMIEIHDKTIDGLKQNQAMVSQKVEAHQRLVQNLAETLMSLDTTGMERQLDKIADELEKVHMNGNPGELNKRLRLRIRQQGRDIKAITGLISYLEGKVSSLLRRAEEVNISVHVPTGCPSCAQPEPVMPEVSCVTCQDTAIAYDSNEYYSVLTKISHP